MIVLSVLAYTTVFGNPDVSTGINFVVLEGQVIGQKIHSFLGTAFLLMAGVMLFGTQFSVLGSTARIMAENLVIASQKKFKVENLSKYFFFFLWLQIIAGIVIFTIGFTEPLTLVIISAVLNAFTMFVYSGLILSLNRSSLDNKLKPSAIRVGMVSLAFLFYGGFSVFTIYKNIF